MMHPTPQQPSPVMAGSDGATPPSPRRRGRGETPLQAVGDTPDLPVPDLPARGPGVDPEHVTRLVDRFALSDRYGAVAQIRELRSAGTAESDIRELIGAAIQHVGLLWQSGHWTITQEHAATAVAEAVLTHLEGADEPPQAVGTVATVAADGEWHSLPVRLAAHAFEHAGMHVRYLGAGVPADDVARTLPSVGADVLAVSVTVASNLPGAARTVAAGHAAGLPVLVGGAAVTAERAGVLGADGYAPSVEGGAAIARRWCETSRPTGAEPTLDGGSVQPLVARRIALRDAAFEGTAARWSGLEEASDALLDRVTEDLELHLDHVVAALTIGDDDVYLAQVPWFAAVHAGRKLPRAVLAAQLGALREVLADHDGARALLDRAVAQVDVAAT